MPDVKIKGYSGAELEFKDVPKVWLAAPESTAEDPVLVPFTYGEAVEGVEVTPDFSEGDMNITLEEGLLAKSAVIKKPEGLAPENIAKDVMVAGILGTHEGGSEDLRYVTFMNDDGTVEYGKKAVAVGDDCADPISRGIFSTPTKESTAQYNYTFSGGWATEPGGGINADALKNVTEDRTVYANFIAAVRYYTITYLDSDGTTVLKTESLAYGATPSYKPTSADYTFVGWVPEAATVTGNASYTATWKAKPAFATASWADIKATADAGEASAAFKVGDTKTVILTFADGTKENVTWRIVDIRDQFVYCPSLSPIKQDAKLAIMADHAIARYGTVRAHDKMSYTGFINTELSNTLNGEFYNALPAELQEVIYQTNNCDLGKVFIPHSAELNLESGGVYDFGTFEYFKTDTTNRVVRKLGAEGSATTYWTRTFKNSGSSTRMKTVTATGLLSSTKESNGGNGNFSVVPMFLI